MSDLLLDTHAFLWLMNGDETLKAETRELINKAYATDNYILIASISIWEIAMLQKKGKISLMQPIHQWLAKATALPFIRIIPLDEHIAVESCCLPGEFHGDPADRMIVATARILNVPLLTRDQKILYYAEESYIKAIRC
jgi:PIN domain nuclease of toxin-antitoxin system